MAVPLASGRLENPRIQIRSVDLRSRMSGGGRSAFCATRGFCPLFEEEVSSNRRAGETKIPTGVVVLESSGWETSACVSKSHPQSSCEFDSPAGDESARSSWQERSATVDGSVLALSKQAKAQNGACSTKSAVTVAMSQMCRFMRFANQKGPAGSSFIQSRPATTCHYPRHYPRRPTPQSTIGQPGRSIESVPGYL